MCIRDSSASGRLREECRDPPPELPRAGVLVRVDHAIERGLVVRPSEEDPRRAVAGTELARDRARGAGFKRGRALAEAEETKSGAGARHAGVTVVADGT